jgi:hypothetical protein
MAETVDVRDVQSIVTMVRAGLVLATDLRQWADAMILRYDTPPLWLCDLSLADTPEAAEAAVLGCEIEWPQEGDNEYLACLLLQYEGGTLSWGRCLEHAGRYTDGRTGDWGCEEFYAMLNEFEAAGESVDVAVRQSAQVAARLGGAVARIRTLRSVHVTLAPK